MVYEDKISVNTPVEFSVVMPCLNEAETLATCIHKAREWFCKRKVNGEIIIADNGSTDGSEVIALKLGARLISVATKGYGSAIMGGIAAAKGKYIIVGDADDSYDFSDLDSFFNKLHEGYDLVIGNRFKGQIKKGAMPFLNKYLGNPLLSWIGRLFFHTPCSDLHCGLRGFRKDIVMKLDLHSTGMEFASEMIVKASLYKLQIAEVSVTLSPDGRNRPSHLRRWKDGWRHLRFLLLYSPRWLFLYPGIVLMLIGFLVLLWLLPSSRMIDGITVDVHTLLYAAMSIIIGFQAVTFALFTKVFAINEGLLPVDPKLDKLFKYITLEVGLVLGFIFFLGGFFESVYALSVWGSNTFGPIEPSKVMRMVIPAVTLVILGSQIILSSFFLSILGLKKR